MSQNVYTKYVVGCDIPLGQFISLYNFNSRCYILAALCSWRGEIVGGENGVIAVLRRSVLGIYACKRLWGKSHPATYFVYTFCDIFFYLFLWFCLLLISFLFIYDNISRFYVKRFLFICQLLLFLRYKQKCQW